MLLSLLKTLHNNKRPHSLPQLLSELRLSSMSRSDPSSLASDAPPLNPFLAALQVRSSLPQSSLVMSMNVLALLVLACPASCSAKHQSVAECSRTI